MAFCTAVPRLPCWNRAQAAAPRQRTDFDKELPFGLESDIRHKKPGKSGVLHGFADLEHEDPSYGGRKQFWHVVAKDDAGDVVSEGTFITKIVTKEHFAEKNRQREQR